MNSTFDHAHLPNIKVRGNHLDHEWSNHKSTPYPTSPTESLSELVLKAAENWAIHVAKTLDPDQPAENATDILITFFRLINLRNHRACHFKSDLDL